MYREKTPDNSFLTSDSDFENPGISAFVESPINASNPSLPRSLKACESNWSPKSGFGSIFQSAVCNNFP